MTNVEALKALYAALGGDPADVADATTIVGVLNVIAAKYEGADNATVNAEAIANIAAVAGSIAPEPPEPSENNAQFDVSASFENPVISNLLNIEIPEGVYSIKSGAFQGASKLKTVTIPSTMASIATANAFSDCTALETIIINKVKDTIYGAPWGAPETTQIIWNG